MHMKIWLHHFLDDLKDHPHLQKTFDMCFLSTLHTTTKILDDQTTFIFTGDIPAMWLRDSSVQVSHYVQFAKDDYEIKQLIRGLISRQFHFILDDPYANAFLEHKQLKTEHQNDLTEMKPGVFERKYEIDSLCYPLWLLERYVAATDDQSVYDSLFFSAVDTIIDVWILEQDHSRSTYTFDRIDPYAGWDTLSHGGRGSNVGYTGMSWCGFRPSDDACTYHYHIPSNLFIMRTLTFLIHVFEVNHMDSHLRNKMIRLKKDIQEGIDRFGIINHPTFGRVYAYEVDGLGHHLLMDDPNVPSLLSLPYLDIVDKSDAIYQNTRRMILSFENPYYVEGLHAKGISSQHTPQRYVWPIALAIQGLTAQTLEEKLFMIKTLLTTDANTHQMHESFDVDDPYRFTRPWFAWANTMFALLVMDVKDHLKELIDILNV